jgi:16S rRNA (cytidine1402-2'-O)-methyltransferase
MAKLVIIPTPIGNLEDLSPRARRALEEVDVLACEDTRHTRTIYEALGLKSPSRILSYHEHNEKEASGGLVKLMLAGQTVGLCSDAGMPLVSDPGYRLVRAAVDAGITIEVLPGPSAAVNALVASGLPPSSFVFKGFAPKKPGARKRMIEEDRDSAHTLIFYESPHRIGQLLQECMQLLGDREAAVCAELTKKFERIERGRLSVLATQYATGEPKGEYVLVVSGKTRQNSGSIPSDSLDGSDTPDFPD